MLHQRLPGCCFFFLYLISVYMYTVEYCFFLIDFSVVAAVFFLSALLFVLPTSKVQLFERTQLTHDTLPFSRINLKTQNY